MYIYIYIYIYRSQREMVTPPLLHDYETVMEETHD